MKVINNCNDTEIETGVRPDGSPCVTYSCDDLADQVGCEQTLSIIDNPQVAEAICVGCTCGGSSGSSDGSGDGSSGGTIDV